MNDEAKTISMISANPHIDKQMDRALDYAGDANSGHVTFGSLMPSTLTRPDRNDHVQGLTHNHPPQQFVGHGSISYPNSKFAANEFHRVGTESRKWPIGPYAGRQDVPQYDDMGASGGGCNAANQPNTYGLELNTSGYCDTETNKGNQLTYADMRRILPIGSICFRFLPYHHTHMSSDVGVIQTLTTMNKKMSSGELDGDDFIRHWAFAGILIELQNMQDMSSGQQIFRATLCYHGPTVISNIFACTGAHFQCGNGLYLLLRRIQPHILSSTSDRVRTDVDMDTERFDDRVMGIVDDHSPYKHVKSIHGAGTANSKSPSSYWQLCVAFTPDGNTPHVLMFNGPDWDGAYYKIGIVHKRVELEMDRFRYRVAARDAIHVSTADVSDKWRSAMSRIPTLEIIVGTN